MELDATTPFCLGCGAWIYDQPDVEVSPFSYCLSCTQEQKAASTKRKSKKAES